MIKSEKVLWNESMRVMKKRNIVIIIIVLIIIIFLLLLKIYGLEHLYVIFNRIVHIFFRG